MSFENDLFTALATITAFQRTAPDMTAIFPVTFPQPVRYSPVWPAMRYTIISNVPVEDLCGDGDDTTSDIRVQLDIVAEDHVVVRSLRLEVMGVMAQLGEWAGWPSILALDLEDYDPDTNTYRSVMDYLVTPSTGLGSP